MIGDPLPWLTGAVMACPPPCSAGLVDVVPAEAAVWAGDPYAAVTTPDGWMRGRGAGDMKGGLAMGLLAIAALRRARPGSLSGELGFVSVIEEECTGNGTLAARHFSLTEDLLRELHARVRVRSGREADAGSQDQ